MYSKLYFKTAEFARLCQTTKHTLIHYDEINLLKPAYVGENGYRYYSILQFDDYFNIAELKSLGFSLQEIREKIKDSSPQKYYDMLMEQKESIAKKIKDLQNNAENIDILQKELYLFLNSKVGEVYRYTFAEASINSSKNNTPLHNGDYMENYSILVNELHNKKLFTNFRFGTTRTKEQARSDSDSVQSFYIRSCYDSSLTSRAGGEYLVAYFVCNFDTTSPDYNLFLDYAEKHCIELENVLYEEIIIDRTSSGTDNYIIQVMAKIMDKKA